MPRCFRCLPIAIAMLGCSSSAPAIGVDVTTGHEGDAMTRTPAVQRVDVVATTVEGDASYTASAAPGGALDFGDIPATSALTFEVTGVDATGKTVLRGRSLSGIYLANVDGDTIPVFAQRTDGWARPPDALQRAHVDGSVGVLAERFLLSTGGSSARDAMGAADVKAAEFYDLFSYGPAGATAFGRAASSLVASPSTILLIDASGATYLDYESGTATEITAPMGLASFGDVAGGATVLASDGSVYVVGATRRSGPTKACIRIAPDGTLSYVALSHARQGAAAAWFEGAGLVVVGGASDAPGVEILSPGATAFSDRTFPPDPTEGAGAAVTGAGTLALVGGVLGAAAAPTRTIDPTCSATACTAKAIDGASLPVALRDVSAFATGTNATTPNRMLVVGEEVATTAMTRSYLVDLAAPAATELPLREPRSGARAIAAPNGTLALLGGMHPDGTPALTVETFFP